MPVKKISLEKFESYNFNRAPSFMLASEEYWFADDEANLIATILKDKIDNDWAYVIMALDEDGEYRAEDVVASIETDMEAIRRINLKMTEIARGGKIENDLYKSSLFDNSI